MSGIHKLALAVTGPFSMKTEMEMNALMILVGANGVGKTMILKICYALGTIASMHQHPNLTEAAQFVLDNTFTEQNFNGSLEAFFDKGSVKVEIDNGKVVNALTKDLVNPPPAIFMSADMRTFDAMNMYLRLRKSVLGQSPELILQHMLGAYRLYDVSYVESLIHRCPIELSETLRKMLGSFDFQDTIKMIGADLEACAFFAQLEDGSRKNISTYGKGHQSILNMFIATAP